jgi:hypothetical protein
VARQRIDLSTVAAGVRYAVTCDRPELLRACFSFVVNAGVVEWRGGGDKVLTNGERQGAAEDGEEEKSEVLGEGLGERLNGAPVVSWRGSSTRLAYDASTKELLGLYGRLVVV